MSRRLVLRVVPVSAQRHAVERAEERPRLRAVAALEDACILGAGEDAAVRDREARDFRELLPAAVIRETLARELPRLAEIGAPPDARAVPFACRCGVDRTGVCIVHRVIDRPAFAVRAAHLPVATIRIALEDEAALACSDEDDGQRHRLYLQGLRETERLIRSPRRVARVLATARGRTTLAPRSAASTSSSCRAVA